MKNCFYCQVKTEGKNYLSLKHKECPESLVNLYFCDKHTNTQISVHTYHQQYLCLMHLINKPICTQCGLAYHNKGLPYFQTKEDNLYNFFKC